MVYRTGDMSKTAENIRMRVKRGDVFTRTELNKMLRDPRLNVHNVFQVGKENTLERLSDAAYLAPMAHWISRVEKGDVLTRSELHEMCKRYPDVAVKYIVKHENDSSISLKDILPALLDLNVARWERIRHIPMLSSKLEVNDDLVLLMRKAIHMGDNELYQNIVTLGVNPHDTENEYYDHFSSKIKGLIRLMGTYHSNNFPSFDKMQRVAKEANMTDFDEKVYCKVRNAWMKKEIPAQGAFVTIPEKMKHLSWPELFVWSQIRDEMESAM